MIYQTIKLTQLEDKQRLEEVIYFLIDMTTRTMRKHTHQVMKEAGLDLTIDQFIVLKILEEKKALTQIEMAQALVKDNASITRIIELLVTKKLLSRQINEADRRMFKLELTEKGIEYLRHAKPIVFGIRRKGIENVSDHDLEITKQTLRKITDSFS